MAFPPVYRKIVSGLNFIDFQVFLSVLFIKLWSLPELYPCLSVASDLMRQDAYLDLGISSKCSLLWGLACGPVAKTPCSQRKGHGFDLWLGNYSLCVATKSSQVTTKDIVCHS